MTDDFISHAEEICAALMFGVTSDIDLTRLTDDITSTKYPYLFIQSP